MFLHLSVILFTWEDLCIGGLCIGGLCLGGLCLGGSPSRGFLSGGRSLSEGGLCPGVSLSGRRAIW